MKTRGRGYTVQRITTQQADDKMSLPRNVHIHNGIAVMLGLIMIGSVTIHFAGFPNHGPNQPLFTTTRHPSVRYPVYDTPLHLAY